MYLLEKKSWLEVRCFQRSPQYLLLGYAVGPNDREARDPRVLVEAMTLEYSQNGGVVVVTPEGKRTRICELLD